MPDPEQILDPAHDPDLVVAGVPQPKKPDDHKPGEPDDEFKVSDDGNVAEHKGTKYVRQEALHEERQKVQKLTTTLSAIEPLLPEFNEFLNQKQGRSRATVDRAARGGSDSEYTEDELKGFAITRGYVKEDGTTPDLDRAEQELNIITGINKRQTRREVEPIARTTRSESARLNRERALQNRFVDGQPIADAKYIEAAAASLGDDLMADPQVANLAQVVAAGLQALDERKNGTTRQRVGRRGNGEPMMVEGRAGRFDGDPGELSDLDRAAARARGKTPEQWQKISKAVNKAASGVLEEV